MKMKVQDVIEDVVAKEWCIFIFKRENKKQEIFITTYEFKLEYIIPHVR